MTTTPLITTTDNISNATTVDQTPSPTGHSVPAKSSTNGGICSYLNVSICSYYYLHALKVCQVVLLLWW